MKKLKLSQLVLGAFVGTVIGISAGGFFAFWFLVYQPRGALESPVADTSSQETDSLKQSEPASLSENQLNGDEISGATKDPAESEPDESISAEMDSESSIGSEIETDADVSEEGEALLLDQQESEEAEQAKVKPPHDDLDELADKENHQNIVFDDLGGGNFVVAVGGINVRDLPTVSGSQILGSLSEGEPVCVKRKADTSSPEGTVLSDETYRWAQLCEQGAFSDAFIAVGIIGDDFDYLR